MNESLQGSRNHDWKFFSIRVHSVLYGTRETILSIYIPHLRLLCIPQALFSGEIQVHKQLPFCRMIVIVINCSLLLIVVIVVLLTIFDRDLFLDGRCASTKFTIFCKRRCQKKFRTLRSMILKVSTILGTWSTYVHKI